MAYVVGAKQNASEVYMLDVTHDAASVGSGAVLDSVVTATGVRYQDSDGNPIDMCMAVHEPAAVVAGIVIVSARVTADNQVTVRLFNPTAGAVDLASGSWRLFFGRF
jgi:hypothetical protein